jgi:hypothetical protein
VGLWFQYTRERTLAAQVAAKVESVASVDNQIKVVKGS